MTVNPMDLTAALDGIRERYRASFTTLPGFSTTLTGAEWTHVNSADDIPVLVAAIEAVLKPHQPGRVQILGHLCKHHENHRCFSITGTEADDVRSCPDCAATVYTSCAGCGPQVSADACPVRAAITSALTGEEAAQ